MKKYLFAFSILFSLMILFDNNVINASMTTEDLEEFNPEDGVYVIAASGNNSMILSLHDNSCQSGANVQISKNVSSSLQHFVIFEEYDDWYTIRNIQSQYNLDVANGSSEPRTNLQQCFPHVHDAQKFKFFKADDRNIYIQSKLGTFIDLANSDTTEGTNVQLFSFNGSIAQKWQLVSVTQELTTIDIPDGDYYIALTSDESFVLDIKNSSKVSGSDMVLNKNSHAKSQIYRITKENDGWYTIKNVYSNLYLDVKDANTTSSPTLRHWMGTGLNSQKFKFYDAGNHSIIIKSKCEMVLCAPSENLSQNSKIELSLYNESMLQKWLLTSCS